MMAHTAARGLIRAVGLAGALCLVFLVMCPCPPWSLKSVIARRAVCRENLHLIYVELTERGIPFDREHLKDIEAVIREMGLTCLEGSEVKGKPADYYAEARADGIVITEEPGNHPARHRFMAGEVAEERFEVDGNGWVRPYGGG